jgi:outer membrane lipoprotein LolB
MRAGRRGLAFTLLLLAGCVSSRVDRTPLPWPQQQALLTTLREYGIDGRVGVRVGEEGWQANARWRQRGEVAEVELSGPFGAGSMLLRLTGDELQVVDSKGGILRGDEALDAMVMQLGFAPPLTSLRHWLLALPDPAGGESAMVPNVDGTPAELQQSGWRLVYEDYGPQQASGATLRMPGKVTATRENIRLRLVVDRWRLKPGLK